MSIDRSPLSRTCGVVTSICALAFVTGSAPADADLLPFTSAFARVIVGAAGVATSQDEQNPTNVGAASSATVNRSTNGIDGSTADGSASAVANFGTLGVGGSGSALTPSGSPIAGASNAVAAFAFWDDFLTAIPNAGSLLVPGAPVSATLTLGLDFTNSLLALDNANAFFSYDLSASLSLIDPVTGVRSNSIVLDDCFVSDPDLPNGCDVGAHVIGIPGNTSGSLATRIAPIALSLAILEPFELTVNLGFNGQCNAGPDDSAVSSCTFDGDALHTSTATLQPLGDFTLVAASGHDYAAAATPPSSGSVPEPGSLALVVSALLPAVLSWRRRSRHTRSAQPPSRNAG